MAENDKKETATVPPPTAKQVAGLRTWFLATEGVDLEELEMRFGQSRLWADIYTSIAKPVWDDGFDKGEQDVWAHQDWDEECIPNPWASTTPYTAPDPAAQPFQEE